MATINGSAGNDSLVGTSVNDLLNGLAGNDTLNGGAGADTMDGGAGNDVYVIDNAGDRVVEGALGGVDTVRTALLDGLSTFSLGSFLQVENLSYTGTLAAQLKGNALDNVILANSAAGTADTLYGDAGNDTLHGYGGDDTLQGGSGNDALNGGTGADMMVGGVGNDTFTVDSAGDRVFEYANGGVDTIRSGYLKDLRVSWTAQVEGLTWTGAAAAVLHGNGLGNVIVSTSAGNDTLNGYAGNDDLDGGGGTDTLIGGLGDDLYRVTTADVVQELAGQGTDGLIGTQTSINLAGYSATVENLFYTGASGVTLTGNGLANVIVGGAGNDVLYAGAGDDWLAGGAGADTLNGSTGDDDLYGGGLSGFGVPVGGGVQIADTAADSLAGGAGNDTYWIDALGDTVTEALAEGTLDVVNSSIDNSLAQYANVEALVLRAGSSAWLGRGSTRSDIVAGHRGDNHLVGGLGDDTLSGNAERSGVPAGASDVLDGGDGSDVLLAFAFAGASTAYAQDTTLLGGAGNDLYVLDAKAGTYGGLDSAGVDTAVLVGNCSIQQLDGVENLVLYGTGSSAAEQRARAAIEAVWAAAHGSAYTGGIGTPTDGTGNELANTITGNSLGNRLFGLAGNDMLSGGAGNDTLDGGAGTDVLVGGVGNDRYVVDGADTVTEGAGAGFDVIVSATLTSTAGFANVEGLEYTGSTGVTLSNGSGNTSNDYFGGGSGHDTLLGYGGNDTLKGGTGNDSLVGGVGNDVLLGGLGADTLSGGDGGDRLYAFDNAAAQTDASTSSLQGGNGADTLVGSGGGDSMSGDADDDTMTGNGGNDSLSGGSGNDTLVGNEGNDSLVGGTQTRPASPLAGGGDVLWGSTPLVGGGIDADEFHLVSVTGDNGIVETSIGSGVWNFNCGVLLGDFTTGDDLIRFASELVGDQDAVLENVAVKDAAGGTFAAGAEMVIFREDVAATFNVDSSTLASFDANSVAAVIGPADGALAVNTTRVFVVDNGASSAAFLFQSNNGDAAVTTDELYLLAVVHDNATLVASDFALIG